MPLFFGAYDNIVLDNHTTLPSADANSRGARFPSRGIPEHIRSDSGPEFTAKVIRDWLNQPGVKKLFIEPRAVLSQFK